MVDYVSEIKKISYSFYLALSKAKESLAFTLRWDGMEFQISVSAFRSRADGQLDIHIDTEIYNKKLGFLKKVRKDEFYHYTLNKDSVWTKVD